MFYTYILKSTKNNRYYVGSTKDIEERLVCHNLGKVRSTKGLIPLELVYKEVFKTLSEARKIEIHIKKQKSRKYIEDLIRRGVVPPCGINSARLARPD